MIYLVTLNQELFDNDAYKIISVKESLEILEPLQIVGLDTETSGLDCWTKELLSVQLGCRDFQVVIDCKTIDILQYKEYLESDRLFIGWNLKFDLKFLYRKFIIPKNVYDGYLAEKMQWVGYPSGMHSLSLKSAGYEYLGIELDKSARGKIIYQGLNTETIIYSANDVAYLEDIRNKQLERLKEKDLLTALEYENRFVRVLAYIEYCGVKLDKQKWKIKMEKDQKILDEKLSALNKWVEDKYPNDSRFCKIDLQGNLFSDNPFDESPHCIINWSSQKQVIPLLEEEGLNLFVKDKETGELKKSIEAKVIKPQKDKSEIVTPYVEYSEAQKVVSTYGKTFIDQINPISKRLHTQYSQIGADTYRVTSGGEDKENKVKYINFLNLPADAETRACFVAENGNSWISIDYAGQESALLASIANDELMLKELNEGSGDIHSLVASLVFKKEIGDTPLKEIKKKFHDLRQIAKGYEFLIAYGGNADTIQQNYGKSKEESEQIYNSYMDGLKGVQQYQKFCRKDVMDKGYILLNPKTGHKAYIYDYNKLIELKESFTQEFWEKYKEIPRNPLTGKKEPRNFEEEQMCKNVKKFFKRKSDCEKQSINFRIQSSGALCLRVALINFFNWIIENNLFNIVKISIIPYDEINCEAPKEIAEEVTSKLYYYMVKAGKFFCTRCKLDADISRLEDGSLPSYWIH